MPYSIPSIPTPYSITKILNLAAAPFFFILVGIFCLSVTLLWRQECTFYYPLRKKKRKNHKQGNLTVFIMLVI